MQNSYKERNIKLSDKQFEVLSFINEFFESFTCGMKDEKAIDAQYEILRQHYMAGYCWHFAHMLKDTFERGEVCWAAPFGHFVWKDDDDKVYDAEGFSIYINEAEHFIPERYLSKDELLDFKHIPNSKYAEITQKDIANIIKRYCAEIKGLNYSEIER